MQYSLNIRLNLSAKVLILSEIQERKRIKFALILRLPCEIKNKALPLHQQIPPASRKISVPSGTFLFMGVRYTHQAITTEQQIDILRERGLLIDNVEQAIGILDNIS